MAKLYPTLEQIKQLTKQPEAGELHLLHFLNDNFDDSYEVYFQPFLNGDMPDIIVLRENGGVLIIEVKDWNLRRYKLGNDSWYLRRDGSRIKSPVEQVQAYRENLYNLHCTELFEKITRNPKVQATINSAVYFHCASENELSVFYDKDVSNELINYVKLLGEDSLTKEKITSYFANIRLGKKSYYFDNELYYSIQRFLKPPFHRIEDGQPITYTPAQTALIESVEGQRRKIKGVAGSGKTYVLAKRAVNAHKRTGERVLILTFNLALKNYIHDRINDVRENFDWDNFYITNYHQFFKAQANNYNIKINPGFSDFDNKKFFEPAKHIIKPYKAIFIDEIQDYKQEWLDNIINYFTDEKTELIVFGDEKQNIYERELDDNKEIIVRTIRGQWNKSLNSSYRLINEIANLAATFQRKILSKKYYSDDELVTTSIHNIFTRNPLLILKYYYCNSLNPEEITDHIFRIIKGEQIHSSDTVVLSTSIEMIRNIHDVITDKYREKTTVTFETNEEHSKCDGNNAAIEKIRRLRKNNFWFKTGTIKLSTIHSFKGWEMHTVILLIENDGKSATQTSIQWVPVLAWEWG